MRHLYWEALLDGLSVALSRADYIKIDKLLRMGSFCKWTSAASSGTKISL